MHVLCDMDFGIFITPKAIFWHTTDMKVGKVVQEKFMSLCSGCSCPEPFLGLH